MWIQINNAMIRHGLENLPKLAIRTLLQIFLLYSLPHEFSLQSRLLPSKFIQQSTERGFVQRRWFYIEVSLFLDMVTNVRYPPSSLHSNYDISKNINPIDTRQLSFDRFFHVEEVTSTILNAGRIRDKILIFDVQLSCRRTKKLITRPIMLQLIQQLHR